MSEALHIFYVSFSLAWLVIFGYVFAKFAFNIMLPSLFLGGQYVPSREKDIAKMIEFADIKPGEKAVDLGAGDGRIVMALARKGVEAHGYEINPILVFKANQAIRKAGLGRLAFMHCGNLWYQDISQFDVIVMYNFSLAMKGLERKIKKEAKHNARIICNYFTLPTWLPIKNEGRVYLYKKGNT